MTTCKELKDIVQETAKARGMKGVMMLNDACVDLSYERVSRVWHGNKSAKFSDVDYVLNVLKIELKIKAK